MTENEFGPALTALIDEALDYLPAWKLLRDLQYQIDHVQRVQEENDRA